jgi:hypothetical protein
MKDLPADELDARVAKAAIAMLVRLKTDFDALQDQGISGGDAATIQTLAALHAAHSFHVSVVCACGRQPDHSLLLRMLTVIQGMPMGRLDAKTLKPVTFN